MENKIKLRMEFVRGETTLEEIDLVSVASAKHKTVSLCIAANMNIPIADILLYDSHRFIDAEACFEDARKLGKAMEDAWGLNKKRAALIKTLTWMIQHFDFMKQQTGLNDVDSPELKDAKELLDELQK